MTTISIYSEFRLMFLFYWRPYAYKMKFCTSWHVTFSVCGGRKSRWLINSRASCMFCMILRIVITSINSISWFVFVMQIECFLWGGKSVFEYDVDEFQVQKVKCKINEFLEKRFMGQKDFCRQIVNRSLWNVSSSWVWWWSGHQYLTQSYFEDSAPHLSSC